MAETAEQKARRSVLQKARRKARPQQMFKYHLMATYQITLDEYERLWDRCKGRCEICATELTKAGQGVEQSKIEGQVRACVDHCHKTGAIRGMLCRMCNSFLGRINDDHKKVEAYLGGVPFIPSLI